MGVARFEQGAAVILDGKPHTIKQKLGNRLWKFEDQNGFATQLSEDDMERQYANGTLRFPSRGRVAQCGAANHKLSDTDLEEPKIKLAYVRAILDVPTTRGPIEKAISETWSRLKRPEQPPSWTSAYRWKRLYEASGNDIRSLVDNEKGKGNRTSRYTSDVVAICDKVIEARYMTRERRPIQDTVDNAIHRVLEENAQRLPNDALQLPTRRLITRMIADIPMIEKDTARHGREYARQLYRGVHGHVITDRPLARAEMDHTHLDLFVLDDKTGLPLGRPYVTACIDDYTRCILGIHIGFTPPSFLTVAKCLKEAFTPKTVLMEQFPEIKSKWLAHGVMTELVLDNGVEFHSAALSQVCLSLGITMRYAARKEAWFKGKIERFFGTFNRNVAHGTPGTTFSNIFEKGDYDPTKHAVMTMSVLQSRIRKYIADDYHQHPHRTLGTTPNTMWETSMSLEDIRVPDDSIHLDSVMGRPFDRVLTHKGIEYMGLFYNSPELIGWRQRQGTKLHVSIRVDESDIGSIYVISPEQTEPYIVPCLHISYAGGLSLWLHNIIRRRTADLRRAANAEGWLTAKMDIQQKIADDMTSRKSHSRKRIARALEDMAHGAHKTKSPDTQGASDLNERKVEKEKERKHFALPTPYLNPEILDKSSKKKTPIKQFYRKETINANI